MVDVVDMIPVGVVAPMIGGAVSNGGAVDDTVTVFVTLPTCAVYSPGGMFDVGKL